MSGIRRRRLLTATGLGLTGTLAGCLGSSDETSEENGDENDTETDDAGAVSGSIVVDNLDDASHTFDVLIEYDGEIQSWETRSPDADETITFDHDWSADRTGFRVTARLNGGEPVNITPTNWNQSNCLSIFVRITGEGSMTHSSNTEPGHCDGASDQSDESE